MSESNYLSQLWAWITSYVGDAGGVLAIIAAAIIFLTFLEKGFGVELLGRRVFRAAGRIIKFFWNWVIFPIRPTIVSVKAVLKHGTRLDKSFNKLIKVGEERDARQQVRFDTLQGCVNSATAKIENIEKEFRCNGGESLKDKVVRLVRHNEEQWHILDEVLEFVGVTSLRLDIADEARKCMTFRLGPCGECTAISPMFLRFFGYTDKDILGSDWEFCIAKQSIADVQDRWRKAYTKKTHYRNDQFIVDSDGKEHYCRVQGYPMCKDNDLQGFYGTVEVLDAEIARL